MPLTTDDVQVFLRWGQILIPAGVGIAKDVIAALHQPSEELQAILAEADGIADQVMARARQARATVTTVVTTTETKPLP